VSRDARAIRARALGKRFGAVVALRAVDLDLERGASLAVLGPNGAGKSTLLRILAGLSRPSSGELQIVGRDRDALRRGAARALVGYVGHATLLYPELSALENLVFAARLHGVAHPAARATELLVREGLGDVADRHVRDFSRGMSQRLSIARALVHDPQLVLLDEPFTGLDRSAADRLAERLEGLRRDGRSVVLVTHELPQASRLAERALVLERGRVAARLDEMQLRSDLGSHYASALQAGDTA